MIGRLNSFNLVYSNVILKSISYARFISEIVGSSKERLS